MSTKNVVFVGGPLNGCSASVQSSTQGYGVTISVNPFVGGNAYRDERPFGPRGMTVKVHEDISTEDAYKMLFEGAGIETVLSVGNILIDAYAKSVAASKEAE